MIEQFKYFYENILAFDLIYLIITLLSLIKCSRKGFVLSVLEAGKWLLAYVVTLILFLSHSMSPRKLTMSQII